MEKILVSACLVGQRVRYDGRDVPLAHAHLARWQSEGRLVVLCPEVAGGLPVPRPPAEIHGHGGGLAVLAGRASVRTREGRDVTGAFLAGADAALRLARAHGIRAALLKAGSPSCGHAQIHDGSFLGAKIPGQGVTAARLAEAGLRVFSEHEVEALAAWLDAH